MNDPGIRMFGNWFLIFNFEFCRDGWEKLGLYEYFSEKTAAKKDKENQYKENGKNYQAEIDEFEKQLTEEFEAAIKLIKQPPPDAQVPKFSPKTKKKDSSPTYEYDNRRKSRKKSPSPHKKSTFTCVLV